MIPVLLLLCIGGLMHAATTFAPNSATLAGPELAFGFLLLTAYFAAKLVSRFGLPKLTGYIIAGIVVGPYVIGLVEKGMTKDLKMVGDTATAILALQAGAELEFRSIRPMAKTIAYMTIFAVMGTMVLLTGLLLAIRPLVDFLDAMPLTSAAAVAATMAVALTAQSPAVVMAMLGETRADGPISRTILALVVLADLVVIVGFGVASAATTAVLKGQADIGAAIGTIAWEVFGSMGVGVLIGLAISTYVRGVPRGQGLFALMMCFVVAEVCLAIHLDALIVMLVAGLYLRNFSRADTHTMMEGFEGASLPVYLVFFALAGAKLDIGQLAALALPVGLIVVTRATGFFLGSKLAGARANADPGVRKYAWFGLVPQAGLALALAELVRRTFPDFGNEAFALVVGVVATNELVAPVVLRVVLMRTGEAGKRTTHDFASDH